MIDDVVGQRRPSTRAVLTCDVCECSIEGVPGVALSWTFREGTREVACLHLAHRPQGKASLSHRVCPGLGIYENCIELFWLADHGAALDHLAELTAAYRWTAEHLHRLVQIAHAVSSVAGESHGRLARLVRTPPLPPVQGRRRGV